MNKRIISIILLILATMIWGLAFLFQKNGGDIIGPFSYNGARYLLAVLFLLPMVPFLEKSDNKKANINSYKYGMICGLFLFIAAGFQQLGIKYTNYTGKAGFLTDMYILIVPLFSLIQGKKIARNIYIGILFCIFGFYFLCIRQSSSLNIGDLYLTLCAFFFSLQINYIDMVSDRITTLRFAIGQYFTTAVLSLLVSLLFESCTLAGLKQASVSVLYGGLGSIAIGYTLQIIAQKNLDSITASLIMALESVFCALFTCLFYKEVMPAICYFGCLLIFIGIIVSQIQVKNKA